MPGQAPRTSDSRRLPSRRKTSTAARTVDERDGERQDDRRRGRGRPEATGHEHRSTDRCAGAHLSRLRRSATETAVAARRTRGGRRRSASGPKSGQRTSRRVELGVGRLPDQEVREALLAAGPDDEVGVGQAGRVQRRRDRRPRRSAPAAMPLGDEPPDRVDELGPAGVVERDVERGAGRRRRCSLERVADRARGCRRQLVEPAEEADPDALRAELRGLAADRLPRAARTGRVTSSSVAGPVLAAERVQRQHRDAAPDGVARGARGSPRRPAAWPSSSGRSRWRAQRRLPSMMIATWRGRSVGSRSGSARRSRASVGSRRSGRRRRRRAPAAVRRSAGRAVRGPLDLEDLLFLRRPRRSTSAMCRSVVFWSVSSWRCASSAPTVAVALFLLELVGGVAAEVADLDPGLLHPLVDDSRRGPCDAPRSAAGCSGGRPCRRRSA